MKLCNVVLFLLPLALSAQAAAEPERGEKLHTQHCVGCHAARFNGDADAIYTRADRRVGSLDALQKQVNRCKDNLGIALFDEEVDDIVHYLNRGFYKFEK